MASQPVDFSPVIQQINAGKNQTSIKIKANTNWNAVITEKLKPYQNFTQTMVPAMDAVADYVRNQMIPTTFKNEGPGWPGLAKRTQRERLQAGYNPTHPILRRTGDLYTELTQKAHPKHIETVQTTQNTVTLTIGGSSTKFLQNQLGSSALRLPARPMIPGTGGLALTGSDETAITTIFQQKVAQAMAAQS